MVYQTPAKIVKGILLMKNGRWSWQIGKMSQTHHFFMPAGMVSAAGIMVTVYISEALLSSPTSAKMTASIVASEGTTDISQDTDLLRNR